MIEFNTLMLMLIGPAGALVIAGLVYWSARRDREQRHHH